VTQQVNDFRRRRLVLQMRQKDLAARLGCSTMRVSQIERGEGMKRGEVARRLAKLLVELERV
jgi:transcriptional regulator with XRE-family HTH domain